ncbi:MAG: tetratricopeptide repeat protein [Phycisphaerae bacterium]|jgi:tetratricopeptide (TPR) repeat protein
MNQDEQGQNSAKAQSFFIKASQTAHSNFDYAIELYIEGLRLDPDNLKQGHFPLREVALSRQSRNGKKPTMMERVRMMRGKDPLEQMLNAEYLLAKDPDHLPYMQAMLTAAYTGGYVKTTEWLANVLFITINSMEKPNVNLYILLKDAYASIGQYEKAIAACKKASELKPSDRELSDEYKRLATELTVSDGKYDREGDFRKSIKDRESQRLIQASDGVVKSDDFRESLIKDARAQLAKNSTLPQNIFNLANVLAQTETDDAENEAIELLEDAYTSSRDFSFKQKAGEIRISQLRRNIRKAHRMAGAGQKAAELLKKLNQVQLEHWKEVSQNYPTDLHAKYEYADQLLANKQYDQAIPLFQEAQRDPRRKILAMGKIGVCFFLKGWTTDAMEIFRQAVDSHELKDDAIAKDLQYNLGLCYEKLGKNDEALEIYRKIAQLDFGYRDVSKRVDRLRKNG